MRTRVEVVIELDGERTYRVCEQDGEPVDCWLPGRELPQRQPLDFGGFDLENDAIGFSLGIDRERALFGMIRQSVDDIDQERIALDSRRETPRSRKKPVADPWKALSPDTTNGAQLDMDALLEAAAAPVQPTRGEPVATHSRRKVA